MIWRGNMPGTIELPNQLMHHYCQSYIQTYLERDVRVVEMLKI